MDIEDIKALIDGTATIKSNIIVEYMNNQTLTLTESNSIKDWELMDNRYVEGYGVIGEFTARSLTGNLQNTTDDFDISDKRIKLQLHIVRNGTDETKPKYYNYGTFIVEKPDDDNVKDKTKFQAQDLTILFNVPFDANYTNENYNESKINFIEHLRNGTATLGWLAKYICIQAGVELGSMTFRNSDYVLPENYFQNGEQLRDIVRYIAKTALSWARVGFDDKLYFDFEVKDINSEIPSYNIITNNEYYGLVGLQTKYGPINVVSFEESNVQGNGYSVSDADSIAKYGEHVLSIYDNPIVYSRDIKKQLLKKNGSSLFGLEYESVDEMETIGHPWLIGNELIKIIDMEGNEHITYPFNRTIKFNGHIKTKITCPVETLVQQDYSYNGVESTKTRLLNAEIKVNKATGDINLLSTTTDALSSSVNELDVTVKGISAKVDNIADLTKTKIGMGSITLDSTANTTIGELHITGDVKNLYPTTSEPREGVPIYLDDELVLNNNTYFSDGSVYQGILYPNSNLFTRNTILKVEYENETELFDLPINYLNYINNDICDEFVIKENEAYIIRRVGIDKDGEQYQLSNDVKESLGEYELILKEGNPKLTLNSFPFANLKVIYMTKNQYTDTFSTKVETKNMVDLSESGLKVLISKETDTEKIITDINATPGRIDITGTTTVNKYFQILPDGSMKAVNGEFSGDIYLGEKGKLIGGDGILTNMQYAFNSKEWGVDGSDHQGSWFLGFNYEVTGEVYKNYLLAEVYIPPNFTVTEAYVTTIHKSVSWDGIGAGNCKNIKLYKILNMDSATVNATYSGEYLVRNNYSFSELSGSPMGANGHTYNGVEVFTSANIANSIKEQGRHGIALQTTMSKPSNQRDCGLNTGWMYAIMQVYGYTSQVRKED